MKTILWASLLLGLVQAVFGEPLPPTAEQVCEWAEFSKPVQLTAEKVERRDILKPGAVVWYYSYQSRKDTLCSFSIGLYKAGTLFGDKRTKLETHVQETADKLNELVKTGPDGSNKHVPMISVETRDDGRKVYFSVMGIGMGGSSIAGFTTLGQYDVFVEQIFDAEDGVPQDQKLKNPTTPKTALPDLFKRLEQYILTAK